MAVVAMGGGRAAGGVRYRRRGLGRTVANPYKDHVPTEAVTEFNWRPCSDPRLLEIIFMYHAAAGAFWVTLDSVSDEIDTATG